MIKKLLLLPMLLVMAFSVAVSANDSDKQDATAANLAKIIASHMDAETIFIIDEDSQLINPIKPIRYVACYTDKIYLSFIDEYVDPIEISIIDTEYRKKDGQTIGYCALSDSSSFTVLIDDKGTRALFKSGALNALLVFDAEQTSVVSSLLRELKEEK